MLYDCFTFYNELELLDLRLHMLDAVVDVFVLVEARQTHTGKPKELYFADNKEKFAPFLDKIRHVIVDLPDSGNAWILENYQRNCIIRGLRGIASDDCLVVSDVDEIPRPEFLGAIGSPVNLTFLLEQAPAACVQELFYYYVNCRRDTPWTGSVISRARHMGSPQALRDSRAAFVPVADAGWHFSYAGGVERIMDKIKAYAETQNNTEAINNEKYIKECMEKGKNLFGIIGEEYSFEFIDMDFAAIHPYFPEWLEKYPQFVLKSGSA